MISTSIKSTKDLVLSTYRVEIWQAIRASLGVIASLSLKGRDNCLVLIYEGPSGTAKSILLRVVMGTGQQSPKVCVRVDEFTPASFVSNAANRTTKQLGKIDLLPKLVDKVMVTKELAPIFRGDDKELRKNFARLISILDGNGYKTQSGTHGGRGYEGRYVFNWLGATTPIPNRTHKIMAQLGNRFLSYELNGEQNTEESLMDFAKYYKPEDSLKECQEEIDKFVREHFERFPINSVDPESISIADPLLQKVVRYAMLICAGRVEIESHDWGELEIGEPEGPQRVILLLQMLVRGLALADSRKEVTDADLDTIRHIAISSLPPTRRKLLRALVRGGGSMKVSTIDKALGTSRPTSHKRMRELGATSLASFQKGDGPTSEPSEIALSEDWLWLLDDTPLKESRGV